MIDLSDALELEYSQLGVAPGGLLCTHVKVLQDAKVAWGTLYDNCPLSFARIKFFRSTLGHVHYTEIIFTVAEEHAETLDGLPTQATFLARWVVSSIAGAIFV
jgi:hypothetical protein